MNLTPTTKGTFLAGIALWVMLWLGLFKIDELVGDSRFRKWLSTEDCIRWISRHRGTTLLGTELVNYGTHGISQADGVVFAAGGTLVNLLVIFLWFPLRSLLKRKL